MKIATKFLIPFFGLLFTFVSSAQYVLEPTMLPASINNDQYNRFPTVSNDGKHLVFFRMESANSKEGDWMWSQLQGDGWGTPEGITSLNNTKSKKSSWDFPIGFEGNELILTRYNDDDKTIYPYRSRIIEDRFSLPIRADLESEYGLSDLSQKDEMIWFHSMVNLNPYYIPAGTSKKLYLVDPKSKEVVEEVPDYVDVKNASRILVVGKNALIIGTREDLTLFIKSGDAWSDGIEFRVKGIECQCLFLQSVTRSTLYFSFKGNIYTVELPVDFSAEIDFGDPKLLATRSDSPQQVEQVVERTSSAPNFHALLIGIDDYQYNDQQLADLDRPFEDAEALKEILVNEYSFDEENVMLLKNPVRADLIDQFERLAKEVGEKDNLLIFYAGHGVLDDDLDIGYWMPADAKLDSKANWISNSTIRDYIAGVKTQHTLLISDACFSGSIFKNRQIGSSIDDLGFSRLYKMPSRRAMTSGTLKSVPDESRFMKYLLKRLRENEDKYLPSKRLFYEIETAVINNTSNIPQYGTIQNAGDEGGDFVFLKRKN